MSGAGTAGAGPIAAADITAALRGLGVRPGGMLLVHSALQGSGRVEGLRSRDKLDTIVRGLQGAVDVAGGGGTLVAPTFTYSFCRGEVYDADASPSTVGALGEHLRRQPGVRRTLDPIFSSAVAGPVDPAFEEALFRPGDVECFGPRSIFAQLLARDGQLLFYDAGFGFCTFVHHVEWLLGVRYRFLKRFSGVVRAGGLDTGTSADFLVRPLDGSVETFFGPLEQALLACGGARRGGVPGGPSLLVADARAVLEEARRGVAANPDFLLARGHPRREAAA